MLFGILRAVPARSLELHFPVMWAVYLLEMATYNTCLTLGHSVTHSFVGDHIVPPFHMKSIKENRCQSLCVPNSVEQSKNSKQSQYYTLDPAVQRGSPWLV